MAFIQSYFLDLNVFDNVFRISVTFVDKDGEEKHIKVPVGMSMLEAAHENDIELEGSIDAVLILCFRLCVDYNVLSVILSYLDLNLTKVQF